jgi:nicotinate-nucleotide--dimethylbenzimidazole phosphoribosyltransferase
MALEPLLTHGVTVGEGAGGLLALPLVQAAAALAAELPEKPKESEGPEVTEEPAGPEASDAPAGPEVSEAPAEQQ